MPSAGEGTMPSSEGTGGTGANVGGPPPDDSDGAGAPSCIGLPPTCGAASDGDCCASSSVPGGTFNRENDPLFPATLSDFRLDIYEVSVGRFRNFVADYPANKPSPGSGKNPNDASDAGWDAAWLLPQDQEALIRQLHCDRPARSTWRDTPEDTENLPMNCMTWMVAYAFCIWDGGRLPTEAEWNYAAAGGSEQRHYPWSNPPESTTVDASHAVYNTSNLDPALSRVGSRSPLGDGRWGHADLAGDVWEFTLDQLADYPLPCIDCKTPVPPDLADPQTNVLNMIRGGGFWHSSSDVWSGRRSISGVRAPEADIGARCARVP